MGIRRHQANEMLDTIHEYLRGQTHVDRGSPFFERSMPVKQALALVKKQPYWENLTRHKLLLAIASNYGPDCWIRFGENCLYVNDICHRR